MTPIHRHKKPRSGYPNQRSQQDIAPQDPRIKISVSYATINQPQNTYIHHHHPHIMNPSHIHKKPRSDSPNWRDQCNIASGDPRHNSSGFDTKIKDRRDSSRSEDNGHYREGNFFRSHSSHKRWYCQSHDSHQPDDINDKDTVEDSWSVVKSTKNPSAPGSWHRMKQWIVLSTVWIGDIILVQDQRFPRVGC